MLHLLPHRSHRSLRIGSLLILLSALLIPAAPPLAPVAHAAGFLAPADIPGTGRNTNSVAIGDLNADGILDLVLGNGYGDVSQVVLGDGLGGFTTPADIPGTERNTRSVALGDLNADGKLDILLGNYGGASQVALGDGLGGFAAPTDIPGTGGMIYSVALGDLNADKKLDLVLGNEQGSSQVALGDGLGGFAAPAAIGGTGHFTRNVVLGDLNGDGDLDLVLGNNGPVIQVALGDGLGGFMAPTDIPGTGRNTTSVAMGDLNGDGDLDLVLGNDGSASQVVLGNEQGGFMAATYVNASPLYTYSVALGDLNGDAKLDLVLGNCGSISQVTLGDGHGGFMAPTDIPGTGRWTYSVALGDLNADGKLDLVLGNWQAASQVALGDGLGGFMAPSDIPGTGRMTSSAALADLNGDGKLDVVLGNADVASQVMLGDGLGGFAAPTDIGGTGHNTYSMALGDLNDDAKLDLVLGNNYGYVSQVALGDGLGGFMAPTNIPAAQDTSSVALGDLNADGKLDLVLGNGSGNHVALGDGLGGFMAPTDIPNTGLGARNVALGDLNGDGKLDLVLGKDESQALLGDGLGGFMASTNIPRGIGGNIFSVALGDLNSDGKLDLVFGVINAGNMVVLHVGQQLVGVQPAPPTISVQRPGPTPDAAGFSTPAFLSGTIPISYTLTDPASRAVPSVRAFFSLDGGGAWRPAIAATGTITRSLSTSPAGEPHVFNWDTGASGVFGQADNVVVRLIADSQGVSPGGVAGSFAYPAASATTFPFRVRGTLARVLRAGQPVPDASVYHLSAQQTRNGSQLRYPNDTVATTNPQGYLNSREPLVERDKLVAVAPLAATSTYTLALISAVPVSTGLTMDTVTGPGVQNLTVSPDHPLLLLNLNVSLEWDARSDPAFLSQLDANITRASELLFRWTNGQVALGDIHVFNDHTHWDDAHIRIYATNRLRPNAVKGGIVETERVDPDRADLSYFPGQLRMGAIWNRYGEATANLGDDWARTLAHEIGHYALFLDDNYLGQDAVGRLISISSCPGPMSDPYRDDYGSFNPDVGWLPGCQQTLSQLETGRSDWATIQTLYNDLNPSFSFKQPAAFAPTQMPLLLPLALTRVIHDGEFSTSSQALPLDAPVLVLTDAQGQLPAPLPGSRTRGVLFQQTDSGELAIELGEPNVDQMLARGARAGDAVCVYELDQQRQGCVTVAANYQQLALITRSDWQPDMQITPVTSTTLQLLVTGVPTGLDLRAQLFPSSDSARPAVQLSAFSAGYHANLTSDPAAPAFDGLVRIWVNETTPRRETVVDVRLGGNPGYRWAHAPRGNPGYRWAHAPVLSGDGQAILYGADLQLAEEQFFAIQTVALAPEPPPWATPVGQAYRLTATAGVPLADASLNIGYLSGDVPQGQEGGIQIYYWNTQATSPQWELLTTDLDLEHNTASALANQTGTYQLMTSVPLTLSRSGWNLVPFYLGATQALPDALGGAAKQVMTVYGYASDSSPAQPWLIHDLYAPDWVNTLTQIANGGSYWIRATEPVTVPVRGTSSGLQTSVIGGGTLPPVPATYYGFVPVPDSTGGLTVQAQIDGVVCGTATTAINSINGQSADAFAVTVRANDGEPVSCGRARAVVTLVFSDASGELARKIVAWDTGGAILVQERKVFLPFLAR
ncbi:VCBS repeat-containing protein [Chloroflexales bacterium ZM16-3]|nr:VCBS repeat-containing protein [Chloroflexales bacterium ZM16-3]